MEEKFAISEWYVEMLLKLVNYNIILIPFFSYFEAEQYGERIVKIGWKLRVATQINGNSPLVIDTFTAQSQTFSLYGEELPP